MFELARLESGLVRLEPEVFSLPELMHDVAQKPELAADARRQRLHMEIPPDLPAVRADLGLIERVLTNLLDNAIRHTPPGGDIARGWRGCRKACGCRSPTLAKAFPPLRAVSSRAPRR